MGKVESAIQADIIAYLRGLDKTYVVNFGGGASSAKGTPDILVGHRGRFVAFEVKRPDSTYGQTAPQKIRQRLIRDADCICEVVTSIGDVAAVLYGVSVLVDHGKERTW